MYKKAISPVVAVALLLVVAVTAIVGFQTWFNQYSSSLFTDVEQSGSGDDIAQGINNFQNGNIYFNHKTNDNVTVTEVKVGNVTCSKNITLKQGINKIRGCTGKYSDLKDVVVYTDKGIYENKVFEKSLDIPFICESNNESNGFYGGNGTQSSPYQICNCNQLQNMSNYLSSSYELVTNIDCSATKNWNSGSGFDPVGDDSNQFRGTLNGKNYEISGLFINRTHRLGLFGEGIGFDISNLVMDDATVIGGGVLGVVMGGKENYEDASFVNIKVKNSIINAEGGSIGGIIGRSIDGKTYINNSVVDNIEITSSGKHYGGIIGFGRNFELHSSTVSNSQILRDGVGESAGGIIGYLHHDSLANNIVSKNNNVTGLGTVLAGVGGAIGTAEGNVTNSKVMGTTVTGYDHTGGFIGFTDNNPTFSNIEVLSTNVTSGDDQVGGIFGELTGNLYNGSVKYSIIRGENMVGGVLGSWFDGNELKNVSFSNSQIHSNQSDIGGIVADINAANVSDLTSKNNEFYGIKIDGVIGVAENSNIYNVTSKNNVFNYSKFGSGIFGSLTNSYFFNGTSINNTGVLAGVGGVISNSTVNATKAENIIINKPSANDQVSGFIDAGNSNPTIINSYTYNTSLTGSSPVSAFVPGGYNPITVKNSYTAESVVNGSDVIALVEGEVNNSYYDNQTITFPSASQDIRENGIPKTTSQLQNPTSASGIYANWSTQVWDFGTSSEYPRFKWE